MKTRFPHVPLSHAANWRLMLEELECRRVLSFAPGDANEDGLFDSRDIIQVLQAGTYLTGDPANWSEGDWNGDGVFDQLDVVAAQTTNVYHRSSGSTTVGEQEEIDPHIQRTMRLLATSTAEHPNTVRILFYGQSIIKQDWWHTVADDLRDRFPHANLITENRAIGGFTSNLLVKTAETDLYSFYPDLLIFRVYGSDVHYEDIIRRVRERTTAEILILTDPVTKDEQRNEETDPAKLSPRADHSAWMNYVFLPKIARKYDTGLVDLRSGWKQHLTKYGMTARQLLIYDLVHLNRRGEELAAELVSKHLRYDVEGDPEAAQWVETFEIGSDIEWTDDRLTVDFTGNRVDIVLADNETVDAAIRIDGRRPSEFAQLYGVTRTTYYPSTPNWPSLLKVDYQAPLRLEEWRLTLTEISEDQKQFRFEIHGSETGYDGHGQSDQRFVSNSGRVVIDPVDWNLVYPLSAYHNRIDEGFEISWNVVPYFVDNLSAAADHMIWGDAMTVAQGLPAGSHQLELVAQAKEKIRAIRVYHPPRLDVAAP